MRAEISLTKHASQKFSSLQVCLECLSTIQKISGVNRVLDMVK